MGDDQRQHLELARELAIRFNRRYGETFIVPEAAIPGAGARVMDLQHPERKMSKSVDSPLGTIGLLDSAEEITRKVRKAVTDTDGEVRYDRVAKPGLANLLDLLAGATERSPSKWPRATPATATSRTTWPRPWASCCVRCASAGRSWRTTRPTSSRAGPGGRHAHAVAAAHLRRGRRRHRLLPPSSARRAWPDARARPAHQL